MNVARRKSGAFRFGINSPKTAARRTVTSVLKPSVSRPTAPLPSAMVTGRVSAPVRLNSTCRSNQTTVGASSSTITSTARKTRSFVPSVTQPCRRPVLQPTKNRSIAPPPRPPSELALARDEIAELKKQCQDLRQHNDMAKSMLDMNSQKVQMLETQIGMLTQEREMLKMSVDTLQMQTKSLSAVVEEKTSLCDNMKIQVDEKEIILRKLHNDVVDLRGQIRVVVRVRPLLPSEETEYSSGSIEFPTVNSIVIAQGSKMSPPFEFEKVFTPIFSQKEVFTNIEDFIMSALHGYNVGLIAFGQTGSGKTHTMRGREGDDQGIIPRAATFLFEESKKLMTTGWKFEFVLSFMEIYNNEAYDLLNNHALVKLRLVNQKVSLEGLSEHPLTKIGDIEGLLGRADRNRKTAATKCNETSSRSHAIYIWKIKAHQSSTNISTTSLLKLVDLAGSERAKESGATGSVFKEMTNINQSLSTLQKCINMQKSKATHVPYRDTKLTQVLMDCLGGGNSKTMVIVNLNPCRDQAQESKRSVEFASKMRETNIGSAVQQRDL